MAAKSVWTYYYQAKDALQMCEAFFVFKNQDDQSYLEFEKLWPIMKRIGELIAEVKENDRDN